MRKYLLLISFAFLTFFSVQAQEFKKFKFAIGVPFSVYSSDPFAYYVGLDIEPSWRLKDDLTLGLYIGYMQSDSETNTDPSRNLSEQADVFSTCLVLDKYFTLDKPNFYYGLMAGLSQHLYQVVERSSFVDGVPTEGGVVNEFKDGINLSPRFGFNYGHFRAMIMYQLILNEVPDMLTLQVALEIGGGKKSKK